MLKWDPLSRLPISEEPAAHTEKLSKPASAHPLTDNNGLWTSATQKEVLLQIKLPIVVISNLRSPSFGMWAPFANSYSPASPDSRFSEGC